MADIDFERAENLMKSARYLLSQDDLAGVAGLAYQAFESAFKEFEHAYKIKYTVAQQIPL